MSDIHVDPELLAQQSQQMNSLMTEYESLFAQVTNLLNKVNDYWSANMSGNFSGKITAAQKTFSLITSMLSHGSSAAKLASSTFSGDIGAAMDACFGDSELSGWLRQNVAGLDPNFSSYLMGALEAGKADANTILEVCKAVKQGDYGKALNLAADKGIDLIAEHLGGGLPEDSWVSWVNEKTGGILGLANLDKAYYKNLIKDVKDNAVNTYILNKNGDYTGAMKEIGEAV